MQSISKEIFERKYMINEGDESVEDVFRKIAKEVASVEKDKDFWEEKFYEEMISGRLVPAGRILANARPETKNRYYNNCYTIDIDDSMEEIYDSLKSDALISATGGGVGFNISKLRPNGSKTSKGGISSGPISFLKVFNESAKIIQTGGFRRCLPKGAPVFTKQGVVPIEKVTIGTEVQTSSGYRKVSNIFNQGKQETIVIHTENGDFECTPNHKMPVFTGLYDYDWKMAKDITIGDKIVYVPSGYEGQPQSLPEWSYNKPIHSTTTVDIVIPPLDDDMAWFFGYLLGNGYVKVLQNGGKGIVSISCPTNNISVIQKVEAQLKRFGVNVTIRHHEGNWVNVQANSNQLALYWSQFKKPNREISIPEIIKNSYRDIRSSFIAGLFDADGSSSNRPLTAVSTVYETLVEDLKLLLNSLGILSKVGMEDRSLKGWQNIYSVNISNSISVKTWDNIIAPFSLKYIRNRKLELYRSSRYDIGWPSEYVKKENIKVKRGVWSTGNKKIGVTTLERLTERKITLYPIDVVGITSGGVVETFDIEVAEVHEFVVNGFLTHNSAHIAILDISHPDIEDFITCKQGEQNNVLTQFNISVGITDKFMKAVEDDADWDLVFNGTIYKTVKAKYLYDLIMKNAHYHNEPGLFFLDRVNKDNNAPDSFVVDRSNPCGEICVSGDTKVNTDFGILPITEVIDYYERGVDISVYSVSSVGEIELNKVLWGGKTGINSQLIEIELKNGNVLRVTPNHKLFISPTQTMTAIEYLSMWQSLSNRSKRRGEYPHIVYLNRSMMNEHYIKVKASSQKNYVLEHHLNYGERIDSGYNVHHIDGNSLNNSKDNLEVLTHSEHSRITNIGHEDYSKGKDVKAKDILKHHRDAPNTSTIVDVRWGGKEDVYDITVENNHNFFASGLLIHNCMPSWSLCCLSSVNFTQFVKNSFEDNVTFDFTSLKNTIEAGIRFLDNVLDVTKYPLERIEKFSKEWRRIGLGFTGYADMLAMMKMPYNSEEAKMFTDKLAKFFRDKSYETSIEIAKEKGAYPEFRKEEIEKSGFFKKLPKSIKESIQFYGLRNIGINTVAPNGTISLTIGQNCSSGIEPIFSLDYIRKIRTGRGDETTTEKVYDYAWLLYLAYLEKEGYAFTDTPEFFQTTFDVSPYEGVDVQAIWQNYIDHSISKCVAMDTLVTTKDGLKYMHEIVTHRVEDSFKDITETILNKEGVYEQATAAYYNGIRPVKILTLSNGMQITSTPEHKFLTKDGWVKAKDMVDQSIHLKTIH